MSFGPKHQRKVNDCYPMRAGEEGAVSGKISVLNYYINSRPEKLIKVSDYLERKVKKDILRERIGYNKVTLDIVEGIMAGCSEYFGSFAETALTIVCTLSQTDDYELLSHLVGTFAMFGRMAKGTLPTVRNEDFFAQLTQTVGRLTTLSTSLGPRFTDLEVRAMQADIGMEDFKTPQGKERIGLLVAAFLRYFSSEAFLAAIRQPDGYLTDPNDPRLAGGEAARLIATFHSLVKGLNSISLDLFLAAFFQALGQLLQEQRQHPRQHHRKQAQDELEAIRVSFLVMIKSTPSQFLCIFLSEMFRQLGKMEDEHGLVILLDSMTGLLLSNRGPLGYSGLELASNLMRLLKKQRPAAPPRARASFLSTAAGALSTASTASTAASKKPPSKAVFAVCNALVCVLRNNNFASQKYEIINHVMMRAFLPKPPGSAGAVPAAAPPADGPAPVIRLTPPQDYEHHSLATVILDNVDEEQFRAVTWSVLFAMAEESLPVTVLKLAFVEIPSRLFESLFQMIVNPDSEFRLNSLVLLHRLFLNGLSFSGHSLKTSTAANNGGSSLGTSNLPSTMAPSPFIPAILPKTGQLLLAKFRNALYQSGLLENNQPEHICILDALLTVVLREADLAHLLQTISIIASWESQTQGARFLERKALFLVMLHNYLLRVAGLLDNSVLKTWAEDRIVRLQAARIVVFDLGDAFDDYPPPLCLRTSENPHLENFKVALNDVKGLLLHGSSIALKPSQASLVEEISREAHYNPQKDLALQEGSGNAANPAARRSFFPTPKQSANAAGSPQRQSMSSAATLLAHRRSYLGLTASDGMGSGGSSGGAGVGLSPFGAGSMTMPHLGGNGTGSVSGAGTLSPAFTKHMVGSALSVASVGSTTARGASSTARQSLQHLVFPTPAGHATATNSSAVSLIGGDIASDSGAAGGIRVGSSVGSSDVSVLDADFSSLTLRTKEKKKESRQKDLLALPLQ